MEIPPTHLLFCQNIYKKYGEVPELSRERISNLVNFNGFSSLTTVAQSGVEYALQTKSVLFPFKSFLNHAKVPNIALDYLSESLVKVSAARDLKAGEELVFDYKSGCTDPEERSAFLLKKWGITEDK